MSLAGKVCIVTGAGSGIGLATPLLFAAEGATVVAADLDADGEGVTHRVDVTDEDGTLGARRCLASTTAGSTSSSTTRASPASATSRRRRSSSGSASCASTRAASSSCPARSSRSMIAQRSGSIINMSSAIAETGLARRVSYAASKGAVLALTKSMQVDLAPHGVRVNALMPARF